jgi:hypothetical protein
MTPRIRTNPLFATHDLFSGYRQSMRDSSCWASFATITSFCAFDSPSSTRPSLWSHLSCRRVYQAGIVHKTTLPMKWKQNGCSSRLEFLNPF